MYDYSNSLNPTSQRHPIPDKNMVENNAGGFVFQVDKWSYLYRFLIIGSEGGSYYVHHKDLTKQNVDNSIECIKEDGYKVLSMIEDVSVAGKAHSNDPAIFLLALVMTKGTIGSRRKAAILLPKICRTGTHLFTFVHYIDSMRSWGRVVRRAVSSWYRRDNLDYQLVKYQGRTVEGSKNHWTHRDVLRSCHVHPRNIPDQRLFRYVIKDEFDTDNVGIIYGFERLKRYENISEAVNLIKEYRIPHDAWPTELKNRPEVWEAALDDLPLMALIRNLNKLTALGVIKEDSWEKIDMVVNKLTDQDYIKKSKIHPIQALTAMKTYSVGHGVRGNLEWSPIMHISGALEKAFYLSFGNLEPIDKSMFIAVDVSSSMSCNATNVLTCAEIAACMAMVFVKQFRKCILKGFSGELKDINITVNSSLREVLGITYRMTFGNTDCSLPMVYARDKGLDIDGFIVLTDNETWCGDVHPCQALNNYRKAMNKNSKFIVNAMTSTNFSIADPTDINSLDVVGFDVSTPKVVETFLGGV